MYQFDSNEGIIFDRDFLFSRRMPPLHISCTSSSPDRQRKRRRLRYLDRPLTNRNITRPPTFRPSLIPNLRSQHRNLFSSSSSYSIYPSTLLPVHRSASASASATRTPPLPIQRVIPVSPPVDSTGFSRGLGSGFFRVRGRCSNRTA